MKRRPFGQTLDGHGPQPAGWLARVLPVIALILLASSPVFAEEVNPSLGKRPASSAAPAQGSRHQFAIPRQALDTALAAFSAVTRIQVLSPGEITQGLSTPGVSGTMTLDAALRRLLDGTGLTYRFLNADTVTVERILSQSENERVQLEPTTVEGQTMRIEETQVTAEREDTYRATEATTATRMAVPLKETPATVNVVTQELLQDTSARRLEDAIQYVPGVSPEAIQGGAITELNIRGFSTNRRTYVDGYRANERFQVQELANIERIEILKGHASLLYGSNQPGGILNYIYKRPLSVAQYTIEQEFGSDERYRTVVDLTGPLNADQSLLYRLIVAGQLANQTLHGSKDSDDSYDDRALVAPSLTWLMPTGGSFTVLGEYFYQDQVLDPGIKLIDGKIRFNGPAYTGPDSFHKRYNYKLLSEFSQPLNKDWEVTLGGFYLHQDREFIIDSIIFGPLESPATRFYSVLDEGYDQAQVRGEVRGRFDTGPVEHRVLLGAEWAYFYSGFNNAQAVVDGVRPTIDILNPNFNAPLGPIVDRDRFIFDEQDYGFYFQDHLTVFDRWHILGGVRYSDYRATANRQTKGEKDNVSYNAGIVYDVTDWLSPFFSYSTSFRGQGGITASGGFIEPLEGEQFEAGVKTSLLDDTLTMNASFYQIEQTNLAEGDPANLGFSIPVGTARSRGFEYEVSGRVTEALSLYGGYSYSDTKITESLDPATKGNRLRSVPQHKVSLWGKYEFRERYGWLNGASVATGVIHVGNRQGDTANTFRLPTYVRWDLAFGYRYGKWDFHLGIENVLDEDYVLGSSDPHFIAQGAKRFFTGRIAYRFF